MAFSTVSKLSGRFVPKLKCIRGSFAYCQNRWNVLYLIPTDITPLYNGEHVRQIKCEVIPFMTINEEQLRTFLLTFAGLAALSLVAAILLILLTYRRLRHLRLPPDADFTTCLRAVPISVVITLDLLDFGLDVFSVPIAWVLLGKLRLQGLRGVTVLEEMIPGTQLLPTMTLAWIGIRLYDRFTDQRANQ